MLMNAYIFHTSDDLYARPGIFGEVLFAVLLFPERLLPDLLFPDLLASGVTIFFALFIALFTAAVTAFVAVWAEGMFLIESETESLICSTIEASPVFEVDE